VYSSQNGIVYNKDKTTLVFFPIGKKDSSFTIPNTVTTIEEGAFCFSNPTSVTIPASVTSIGYFAFGRTKLTSVTFETGSDIADANFGINAFPEYAWAEGDTLRTAYLAASPKAGTYTRAPNGAVWTKS
jgi:hypothetical protein